MNDLGSEWMLLDVDDGVAYYPTEDYSAPETGSTKTATAASSKLVDARKIVIDRVITHPDTTTSSEVHILAQNGTTILHKIEVDSAAASQKSKALGLVVYGGFSALLPLDAVLITKAIVSYHKVA